MGRLDVADETKVGATGVFSGHDESGSHEWTRTEGWGRFSLAMSMARCHHRRGREVRKGR